MSELLYKNESWAIRQAAFEVHKLPQFGITECLIQYKCSVNTPPSMPLEVGNNRRLKEVVLPLE